jgi:hypothetical protein
MRDAGKKKMIDPIKLLLVGLAHAHDGESSHNLSKTPYTASIRGHIQVSPIKI